MTSPKAPDPDPDHAAGPPALPARLRHAVSHCLGNALRVSGRTTRSDFWLFAACTLGLLILGLFVAPMIAAIVFVAALVPGLTATVRRLHDGGRSGWWVLWPALVIPGWLLVWIASAASAMAVRQDPLDDERYFMAATGLAAVTFAWFALWLSAPSQPGSNAYGPNPSEVPQ